MGSQCLFPSVCTAGRITLKLKISALTASTSCFLGCMQRIDAYIEVDNAITSEEKQQILLIY